MARISSRVLSRTRIILTLLLARTLFEEASAFSLAARATRHSDRGALQPLPARNSDDDDDESSTSNLEDWRDFRAKLVMGESQSQSSMAVVEAEGDLDGIGALFGQQELSGTVVEDGPTPTPLTPLDPSQWAYDSGKVIEQGAVILGGIDQEFGFGLRQQYFHKSAILVLEHDTASCTKGIVLNRPTNLMLADDINPGVKWRIWFGGDVQGLTSNHPDIVCLHSLKNKQATKASISVMKDIQWTTFENAKRLVQVGAADPSDFWVFIGYAGWGSGQLMGELERKSWYMVATDSQTLLQELARQTAGSDPRDAGLNTWTLLMNMIGRSDTARKSTGGFDDLMLKEWARKHLLSIEAGGEADTKLALKGLASSEEKLKAEALNILRESVISPSQNLEKVTEGTLVRASSKERSPFLLDDQEFHKSVLLVIADDENLCVGAVLNRPASKGVDIQVKDEKSGRNDLFTIPLRFGGQFSVKGSEPLLWLHCNWALRAASVGSPFGDEKDGIYKCSADDVVNSIQKGLASPEDFIVVSGVSVWTKGGIGKGMQGEVEKGRFEIVPRTKHDSVWQALAEQEVLSKQNLDRNIASANKAWSSGGDDTKASKRADDGMADVVVYNSDVELSDLSDQALYRWLATFLLGMPSLGN